MRCHCTACLLRKSFSVISRWLFGSLIIFSLTKISFIVYIYIYIYIGIACEQCP